jgi:hypothetical protein
VVRFGRTDSELTHIEIIIEAVKMGEIIEKKVSRGKTKDNLWKGESISNRATLNVLW